MSANTTSSISLRDLLCFAFNQLNDSIRNQLNITNYLNAAEQSGIYITSINDFREKYTQFKYNINTFNLSPKDIELILQYDDAIESHLINIITSFLL